MSSDFKNEVFVSYEPNPIRACNNCGERPRLIRTILDPVQGRNVRMFKCECGEQTWADDKR